MLINELNIQNFRGVPGSLKLDLTAPLTVLYAPNGTGKTSICDAAEWMLCGHVGRLNSLDKNEVRCRFGEDYLETSVDATFEDRNKSYVLKRTLGNNSSILQRKVGAGEYSKVTDRELLSVLVDAIPLSGNFPKGQISWVRSTRFLESDSLNLLIDSDTESNNTQKLIFSNLFGVGDYQKVESELGKILRKLPASSTISREKLKIRKKISDYEEVITKLINDQSEPYDAHTLNLLTTIASNLGTSINLEAESSLLEHHNRLEVKFIQSTEALENQKNVRSFVRENLYIHQDNLSKKEGLDKTLISENNAFKRIGDDFTKKKENHDKQQEIFAQNGQKIIDIASALEELKITHEEVVRLHETYELPVLEEGNQENRLERLSKSIASKKRKTADINERLVLLERLIELIPNWTNAQDAVKGIAIELGTLQAFQYQDTEKESLPERISKVKVKLDVLQDFRKKALGELDLLLSSGKRYVETHEEVSECPLCEFKYESNSVLLGKIGVRFSRLSDKSKEESTLASTHSYLTKLLEQENARLVQIQELTNRKNGLLKKIQEIEGKFIGAGLERDDLDEAASLTQKLEDIRRQKLNEITRSSKVMLPYKLAFEAGNNLEGIFRRLKPIAASWFRKLEQPNNDEPKSFDDLGGTITSLEQLLNRSSLEKKQRQEGEKIKIGENVVELSKAEKEKKEKSLLISSTKKALSSIESDIDDFKKKWTIISKSSACSLQGIEAASLAIGKQDVIHLEIKGLFQKTQYYFEKIREAKNKESARGTYQKELVDAKTQLQEWLNQEDARSMIEYEICAIKEEIRRFIANEIQPLSNIINTLYLRAQGNRFINSIEARPSKEGFLEWIAELDDKGNTFDKMRSLSQGQRQDLALSIFLARARSLGGTFFLDEPLAHLDDLNRVALLDTLRIIVSENRSTNPLRLVLTTANNSLLRHLREKFSLVEGSNGEPALRIYRMKGNPKVGLQIDPPELVQSPNRLLATT